MGLAIVRAMLGISGDGLSDVSSSSIPSYGLV